MTTIKISRTNELINRFRNIKIFIDEKLVGELANGETKAFPITTGQHKVTAKIDWCSSPDISFQIEQGQIKHFVIGGFKGSKWLLPIGILSIPLHYYLSNYKGINFLILLLPPILPLLFYFITIGRKKYLRITEIDF